MSAHSEDDVLVVLVSQHVFALSCILAFVDILFLVVFLEPRSLLDSSVSLLLARHLLQAVKLFSVQLVELGVDVLDSVLGARDNDMFAVISQ